MTSTSKSRRKENRDWEETAQVERKSKYIFEWISQRCPKIDKIGPNNYRTFWMQVSPEIQYIILTITNPVNNL